MKSMKISHVRYQITGFLVFRFYSENMKSTNILMNVEEQNSRPVSLIMIFFRAGRILVVNFGSCT